MLVPKGRHAASTNKNTMHTHTVSFYPLPARRTDAPTTNMTSYTAFECFLFLYFLTHIPITLFIDSQSVYPWIFPQDGFLRRLVLDHVERNEDHLIDAQRSWFVGIATAECLVQFPFFWFALYSLWTRRNTRNTKIAFLMYGAHTATTLIPQFFEMWHYNGFGASISTFNRIYLTCLYGIYFVTPMGIVVKFWMYFDQPWSKVKRS